MSLNIVVDADVAGASQKIQNFARDSRIALTNLSLVVQDLPYGFIGIQNNLPFLVKSFTDLKTASGGTLAALKSMGTALVGPAGLFLAFSAVTSAITFAVQKYGSLGNAIEAVLSKNSALIQRQNELNKELQTAGGNIAAESAKIQILIKSLNDLSTPNDKRLAAYVGLKKISPDIVAGITKENSLTKEGTEAINELAKARLNYLQIRARETAITNQLNKIEEQRLANEQQFTRLLEDRDKAQKAYNLTNKKLFDATATFGSTLKNQELSTLLQVNKALQDNRNERIDLFNASNDLINQLKPLIDGTSQYESNVEKLNQELKDSIKRTAELEKASKKLSKELTAEDLARKARYAAKKLEEQADKNKEKALKEQLRLQQLLNKETFRQADKAMAADAEAFTLGIKKLEEVTLPLKEFEDRFLQTRMFLQQSVFTPLTDIFETFFEKGTAGFKEIGKTILSTIRKLAAQIIASGIIQLVASLINPIGAVQANGPKALDLFSILGNAAKSVLSGAVNRPSFAGVQGGGMNMGGQVSVVLRGQDLIGAINRTNLQIERLG